MVERPGGSWPWDSDRLRESGPIVLVATLSVAVLAGLAVLPARTWLTQREAMSDARTELATLEAELATLEAELELLQTDAEIERLAREDFDLVYPGDESYRIVPPDGDRSEGSEEGGD
jgi:cell division protein FtsB